MKRRLPLYRPLNFRMLNLFIEMKKSFQKKMGESWERLGRLLCSQTLILLLGSVFLRTSKTPVLQKRLISGASALRWPRQLADHTTTSWFFFSYFIRTSSQFSILKQVLPPWVTALNQWYLEKAENNLRQKGWCSPISTHFPSELSYRKSQL